MAVAKRQWRRRYDLALMVVIVAVREREPERVMVVARGGALSSGHWFSEGLYVGNGFVTPILFWNNVSPLYLIRKSTPSRIF